MKIQSLLIGACAIAVLQAQEKPADPFRESKAGDAAAPEKSGPTNISICWETFSLPLAMAAKLQREQLPDSEFYARLVAAVEKQTARQETFTVLRGRSGQRAFAEAISEQIYPTEFALVGLPGTVGVPAAPSPVKGGPATASNPEKPGNAAKPKTVEGFGTPPTPTAFETRNTGMTLEIESTLSEDEKILDLRLVPEVITAVGRSAWGQGVSTTEMPVFEAQRTNTTATLQINRPYLLSTINRPPASEADPDAANRVWFLFITATLAKP